MNDQSAIDDLLLYYGELKTERAPWEGLWRDAARYTLPSSQFQSMGRPGVALTETLYDGTAVNAANILAAELLGMTLNSNSRNFEFCPVNALHMQDAKHKRLMQHISESAQYLLHCPDYGFYTAAHEMLIGYVRFGQGHFLFEKKEGKPRYLSCPMSQCYTDLDDNRKVNAVFRSFRWTLRQLRMTFPPNVYEWPQVLLEKLNTPQQANFRVEVCHAVFPSFQNTALAGMPTFPKQYTHVMFLPEQKHIFEIKGLDVLPYAVPRYMMMSEETYARAPGTFSIPDTKMVNAMEKTNLRAVQKMADPPMLLPRRGWLRPIDSSPSALNYHDGLDDAKITSFGIDGNPQLSTEFVDRHRMAIREMYGVDQLQGPNKKAEMKEVEVLSDQEQRMRGQAPQLARLFTEWLGPVFNLLLYYFNDEILEAYEGDLPDEFKRTGTLNLRVRYMSPLQRAQSMLDATNVKRAIDNFILPVTQIDPNVIARFDSNNYMDWVQDSFNLPAQFILSKEEGDKKIAKQQQQQDNSITAGTAVEASQALKNVAQAQAAMPPQVPGQGVL